MTRIPLRLIWLLLAWLFAAPAMAASITANPTTCVDDASNGGTYAWSGLTNVGAQDNTYATASGLNSSITHYLVCTGYSFAIPAGATIDGIATGPWVNSTYTFTDNAMQLVKAGVVQATNLATGANTFPNGAGAMAAAPGQLVYGGSTNLWGNTWTVADINATNFGAAFAAQRGPYATTQTVGVDALPITVYYTPSGGGGGGGGGTSGSCTSSTVSTDTVITCTGNGSITIPSGVTSVRYLVVGGGGGGGGNTGGWASSGGGAGGVLNGTGFAVTAGTYAVTVGAGGAGGTGGVSVGANGSNSTFSTLTAIGGGGGASQGVNNNGSAGGSGGGGRGNGTGGAGTAGQGNAGGDGGGGGNRSSGGGGGAGTAGVTPTSSNGGNGGDGISDNITGTATFYGGGGGGGANNSTFTGGTGGLGGGATAPTSGNGVGGTPNTGGGGSGTAGGGTTTTGGAGGSGIVVIRYTTPVAAFPSVSSINTASTNPTSPNTSVSWTVTFDQSVTGVDTTDFTLVQSGGAAGASITSVSGSGTAWTVTANTGTGTSGTLGLNLVDDDTIVNSSITPLGGTGAGNGNFTGQTYTLAASISALATYQMDEASWNGTANEVADSSGNGYNAQSFNSATTDGATPAIGGSPGTCRYGVFDNGTTITSGYVQTPLPNLTTNFTVTAWVRTTDNTISGQRILIDDQNNTGGYGISLGDGGTGRIRFYSRGIAPIILDSTVTLANNTWYFTAVVADITNRIRTVYVFDTGGALLGSASDPTPFTGTWGTDAGPISIGGETNASTETPASFHFRGNIDEVQVFNAALSQAQAALIAAQTHPCTGFDHVLINAPTSAMALSDVPITIEPHTSTHTAIPNAGTILLTTSTGQGDWSIGTGTGTLTPGPANSGQATYTFGMTESIATLDLVYPAAGTVTIGVVDNASSANLLLNTPPSELANTITFTMPNFVFTDSACQHNVAFGTAGQCALVSWSPQVAGQNLTNVYITNVNNAGIPRRLSRNRTRTRNIDFGLSCHDPASNAGMQASFAGVTLPLCEPNGAQPTAWSTAVTATFPAGVPSAGPYTFNYPDVGKVELWMRNTNRTNQIGSSNPFVVVPHHFGISGVTGGPIKAGNNFSATMTALNALGATTPNFGQESSPESVAMSFTKCQPTGTNAVNGSFSGSVGAFAAGVTSASNLNWSEVGNGDLVATNTSYLGSGVTTTGNTGTGGTACNGTGGAGNVGPFIPDHFDTTVSQVSGVPMPCPSGLTCPALYNGFVYSGQAFTVNVYARNAAGSVTQNYDGTANTAPNFAKAVTLTAWDAIGSTTTQNPGGGALSNNTVPAASFTNGTTTLGTPATPIYTFGTVPTVPTDIYVRAKDTDNTTSLRGASSVEGGVKVVSGRIDISNAHGSELLSLPISVAIQYWDGTSYVTSDTDSVSSFSTTATGLTFSNCLPLPPSTTALPYCPPATLPTPASVVFTSGTGSFTLSAPGANNTGSVDMSIGVPSYLNSNTTRATFGVYSGNSNFIYMQEKFN